jgi:hypothetical protein
MKTIDLPAFAGWNYRVVMHAERAGHHWYAVHEVYYAVDGTLAAYRDQHTPVGNDPDDLRGELELMLGAFDRPVIEEDDLPRVDGTA